MSAKIKALIAEFNKGTEKLFSFTEDGKTYEFNITAEKVGLCTDNGKLVEMWDINASLDDHMQNLWESCYKVLHDEFASMIDAKIMFKEV